MSPTAPRPTPGLMIVHPEHPESVTTGWGWTIFASLMMLASATVNGIWGLAAILDDDYWGGDEVVAGHEALWGWVWIGFATFLAAVALGVLIRNSFAVLVAIGLTVLSVIAQAVTFDNYPIWSGVVLALDALILWALIRHGFDT
jgi:hypothetical protein